MQPNDMLVLVGFECLSEHVGCHMCVLCMYILESIFGAAKQQYLQPNARFDAKVRQGFRTGFEMIALILVTNNKCSRQNIYAKYI